MASLMKLVGFELISRDRIVNEGDSIEMRLVDPFDLVPILELGLDVSDIGEVISRRVNSDLVHCVNYLLIDNSGVERVFLGGHYSSATQPENLKRSPRYFPLDQYNFSLDPSNQGVFQGIDNAIFIANISDPRQNRITIIPGNC